MLENIHNIIKLVVAISGLFYVIKTYREAQGKHPVFSYDQHSMPNASDWRWRKPDGELALKLTDDEQKSCLQLPVQLLFFEKVCIIVGCLGMVFVLFLYGMLVMGNAGWPEYLIGLMFVVLSMALLNVGSRVSSLTLYADHLVIMQSYAFILKRIYIYKHSPKLSFSGKSESIFEISTEHTEPDFKLYIKRRYFFMFSIQQRFILSVNQSQGSWLVAGLNYWLNHAGLQKIHLGKNN